MSERAKSYDKSKENSKFGTMNYCRGRKIYRDPQLLTKRKVIINDSTSKAMYSFPLSRRLTKFEIDNSSFLYNMPSILNKRSASIGYGNKSNILLPRRGKSDNIYIIYQ